MLAHVRKKLQTSPKAIGCDHVLRDHTLCKLRGFKGKWEELGYSAYAVNDALALCFFFFLLLTSCPFLFLSLHLSFFSFPFPFLFFSHLFFLSCAWLFLS